MEMTQLNVIRPQIQRILRTSPAAVGLLRYAEPTAEVAGIGEGREGEGRMGWPKNE